MNHPGDLAGTYTPHKAQRLEIGSVSEGPARRRGYFPPRTFGSFPALAEDLSTIRCVVDWGGRQVMRCFCWGGNRQADDATSKTDKADPTEEGHAGRDRDMFAAQGRRPPAALEKGDSTSPWRRIACRDRQQQQ